MVKHALSAILSRRFEHFCFERRDGANTPVAIAIPALLFGEVRLHNRAQLPEQNRTR